MGYKRFLILPTALVVFSISAGTQTATHHFPTPPESMDPQQQSKESRPTPSRRIDFTQVQHEADELAQTAQTIPTDIGSVRQGMLPKDVVAKLKQIEKLSKHLRSELGQ